MDYRQVWWKYALNLKENVVLAFFFFFLVFNSTAMCTLPFTVVSGRRVSRLNDQVLLVQV